MPAHKIVFSWLSKYPILPWHSHYYHTWQISLPSLSSLQQQNWVSAAPTTHGELEYGKLCNRPSTSVGVWCEFKKGDICILLLGKRVCKQQDLPAQQRIYHGKWKRAQTLSKQWMCCGQGEGKRQRERSWSWRASIQCIFLISGLVYSCRLCTTEKRNTGGIPTVIFL